MDVKFPYEYAGEGIFGKLYRPVARVMFYSPKNDARISVWMVVDTGADHTILPVYLAQKLRISVENDCVKDVTYGVGGAKTIYFYKKRVKTTIGTIERNIPIAFIDGTDVPPLLGRLGFLETFDTTFLKKRSVVFKE